MKQSSKSGSVAFDMFDVLARDWPVNPRHVIRISRLLGLLDCVPILFRSEKSGEVVAGTFLASSILSSYHVTKRWGKLTEVVSYLGELDDTFPDEVVASFATSQKSRLAARWAIPPAWRPKVINSLDGPFFRRHIHRSDKRILDKLAKKYPDTEFVDEPGWRQRRSINVAFDMVDELSRSIVSKPEESWQLADKLNLFAWIPKLIGSRYRKDVLSGCFLMSTLPQAYARAGEWEGLAGFLERVGELREKYENEEIIEGATILKACYGHQHNVQLIPEEYRSRIRIALDLPFFQNHFDGEYYQIEVLARDRHMRAEEHGKGFAKKLLEAFPELQTRYTKAAEPYSVRTPPQTAICELVLLPAARRAVRTGDQDFLRKLTDFLEQLIEAGWDLEDVYGGSVIVTLCSDKRVARALNIYAGEALLRKCEESRSA